MKKIYALVLLLFTALFTTKTTAQVVIDTNLTAYKNIFLNAQGQQTLVLNTNSYDVATDSVFFSRSLFTCADRNDSVPIVITITDTSATPKNTYFVGSTIIWTIDNLSPVLHLKSKVTIYVANNGQAKLLWATVDSASTDNCGISVSSFAILTPTTFFCNQTGTQTINVKVADANGNLASKNVLVTVADSTKPNLKINQNLDTLYLSGSPLGASLTWAMLNAGSTDNCGLGTATLNGQSSLSFTCSNLGLHKIAVALNDTKGNTAIDTAEIYVVDTLGFTYTKHPKTAYLVGDSAWVNSSTLVTVNTGGCYTPAIAFLSANSFACANALSNPNYIRFQITSGPYTTLDSVAVTVLDTVKPVLALQTDTFYMAAGGISIGFASLDAGSTDNCGLDSATVNGGAAVTFGCSTSGAQTINVVLYDVHGNSRSGSVAVFIIDTLAPSYTKTPYTAYLNGQTVAVSRANLVSNLSGGCTGSPVVTFLSDTVFTCADITNNPNFVRFNISAGSLVISDSVAVTVLDTLKPVLALQSDTLYLSGSPLQATLTFATINNGTVDNCAIDSATVNGASSLLFTCANVGAQTITAHVWDVQGNMRSGSVQVWVADANVPTYTKTPQSVYLNTTQAAVSRGNFLSVTQTGCAVPQVAVLSDTVFTCADVLSNPNFIKFKITAGALQLVDSVAITVLDTLAPTLALQSDTFVLSNNGLNITFADINNGSTDNCTLDSALLDGATTTTFACADTGWQQINVVLFDGSGNASAGSVQIYILDTLQPSYTKVPFTAYLLGDSVAVSRGQILSNIIGGCGSTFSLTLLADTIFTCGDVVGNPHYIPFTLVTSGFSVLDSVPVTVLDTVSPNVVLQPLTVYVSGSPLQATVQFSQINNGSADNCGITTITLNGQPQLTYSCPNLGPTMVEVKLTDASGNVDSATTTVIVLDTIPPSYQKANYTAYVQTGSVAVPFQSLITNRTAGCSPPQIVALDDTVFTCAAISANPNYVRFSASAGGQVVIDSIMVTVLDTVKPNLLIPAQDTVILYGTSVIVNFSDFDLGSTDNCGLDSATLNGQNQLTFTCSSVGNQLVTVTLIDVNGNMRSKTMNVFVLDTVSPTYTKTPYTAYLPASGTVSVSRSNILSNISAGCSTAVSAITILSDTVFTCVDVRTLPYYVVFSASAGLITTVDSVPVFVADTLAPNFATKPPQNLYLGANGTRAITLSDLVVAPPTDNCGVDSVLIIPQQLTCANTGSFLPVAIQAWDASGNLTTKFMFVLAVDTIKPTLAVKADTLQLDSSNGVHAILPTSVIQVLMDNCSISNYTITPNFFSCAQTGLINVTITATDPSGNSRTRQTTVFVQDVTPPTVLAKTSHNLFVDNTGQATLLPSDVLLTTPFDACGVAQTQLSQTLFTCNTLGTQLVLLSVSDQSGNTTQKNVLVTVSDTISPTAITQNAVVYLDTNGIATLDFADVVVSTTDNCGINQMGSTVSPSVFGCADVGLNAVTITITDVNGNIRTYKQQVDVRGPSGNAPEILGPTSVCGNQYNVRYVVDTVVTTSDYSWIVTGGSIVSTSFKGREIYVHWGSVPGSGSLQLFENTTAGCKLDTTEITVLISGLAPDTTTIRFWDETTQTTLVVLNTKAKYYQWGYDQWAGGNLVSTSITGETKTSYHNQQIGANIAAGYKYWCELSMDGQCWNRSYFQSYPISVDEHDAHAVAIYPNPFTEMLTIESSKPMNQLIITDMFGKTLMVQTLTGERTAMVKELAQLAPATYFVRITHKDGTTTNQKIIRLK